MTSRALRAPRWSHRAVYLDQSWRFSRYQASGSRGKNHSQWSEITLVDHCRNGGSVSCALVFMCAPILFTLVDLSPRMLSGTLSYLPALGALSVSEQSEQRRLLDAFRSHYFARSTLPCWRRSSRGNARNASHGHALLDVIYSVPGFVPPTERQRSAKESTRKIPLLLRQGVTINRRRLQSTRQFNHEEKRRNCTCKKIFSYYAAFLRI